MNVRASTAIVRGAALAALLSLPLPGQEVQVSGNIMGNLGHVAASASGFRMLWDGESSGVCGGWDLLTARAMSASGTFLTPGVAVPENCISQQFGDIAVLPSGVSLGVFSNGFGDVRARLFDPSMAAIGPELVVNTDSVMGNSRDVRVAAVGTDRFVAVWQNPDTATVYGRVVVVDGTLPFPPVVFATGGVGNHAARVAAFGNGDVVVAWYRGSTLYDVIGRIYDASLQPVGSEMRLNQVTASLIGLSIAAGGSTYAAVWGRRETVPCCPTDVVIRFFDRATGPLGNEQIATVETTEYQMWPELAVDASGSAIVAWSSNHTGSLALYGRRFDGLGAPLTGEFSIPVQTGTGEADLAMHPSGGFVATWNGCAATCGHVLMRRFFFPVSLALAPGPGSGNPPRLAVRRPDGSPGYPDVVPFGSGGYGATVGAGDIEGDAIAEVLAGPGPSPSYGPQVRAFERDGTAIAKVNFYAYGTLRYGVKPRAADLDSDGIDEILTTPGPGPPFGPHVRAFDFDGGPLSAIAKVSFFAFSTLQWGANADGAELDGDGYDEMVAAPGPGASFGPQVKGFDYDGTSVRAMGKVNFYAFASSTHGATVATADVESNGRGGYRDGYDEIAAGRGPGAGQLSTIRLFDYDADAVSEKHTEGPPYPWWYGVELGGGDVDAGDSDEVVTAPGPDPAAASRVLCWDWSLVPPQLPDLAPIGPDDFVAFPGGFGGHVAVGKFE